MKKIVTGILAHVDAGKTTLSEAFLYKAGSIRKLGRVDHRDAFLDTDAQERERGITIYSKQARLCWKELELILLDTPGHVDFSAEMERALQVLDYAVLVISGTDGVQAHTETLWKLLSHYRIPTFLFVNKMDLAGADQATRMINLKTRLSGECVDFTEADEGKFYEELAVCSEKLLEAYMEQGSLTDGEIAQAVAERRVFPVYFGSALKLCGVEELLDGMERYCAPRQYADVFGAKVYKIGRDEQGKRLTWLKITGGSLAVREPVEYAPAACKNAPENIVGADAAGESGARLQEKIDQIRLYSGTKFKTAERVQAGEICAVTGLSATFMGQGLGAQESSTQPVMAPVMTYRVLLPPGCDVIVMLKQLRELAEEEPLLHIRYMAALQEIHVQLMGQVQIEVLSNKIKERFGVQVQFDAGSIVYRETIAEPVIGMGHYEPLRHYAEVQLMLAPGEPGSGLVFDTACSEDMLDKNWQRLVLTHLAEREHLGVLTGSPVTDMRITLLAGRAHEKHTEGGDFRQATYRAVRHGLMRAKSVLLEPYYEFRMELPMEAVGRAMTDMERMCGKCGTPEVLGEMMVLCGSAPVSEMQGYTAEFTAYTRGRGHFSCAMKGYAPCHNTEEVIAAINYQPEADLENSADSVFCSHGAGFLVPWQQTANFMHLEPPAIKGGAAGKIADGRESAFSGAEYPGFGADTRQEDGESSQIRKKSGKGGAGTKEDALGAAYAADKELEEIFTRTFGEIKRRVPVGANSLGQERQGTTYTDMDAGERARKEEAARERATGRSVEIIQRQLSAERQTEYLLVDGYNVIFAWEELSALAKDNLESARGRLMDILCNYQGFTNYRVILVFDAYRVKGNPGEVQKYHNIHVVYTKEAETADMYIEKVSHELGRKYRVTVATSDALEQVIVIGQGASRMSSRELKQEVERVTRHHVDAYTGLHGSGKNYGMRDAIDKIWEKNTENE